MLYYKYCILALGCDIVHIPLRFALHPVGVDVPACTHRHGGREPVRETGRQGGRQECRKRGRQAGREQCIEQAMPVSTGQCLMRAAQQCDVVAEMPTDRERGRERERGAMYLFKSFTASSVIEAVRAHTHTHAHAHAHTYTESEGEGRGAENEEETA